MTSRTSRADLYGLAVVIVTGAGLGLGAGLVLIRLLNRHEARTVTLPPPSRNIGFRR